MKRLNRDVTVTRARRGRGWWLRRGLAVASLMLLIVGLVSAAPPIDIQGNVPAQEPGITGTVYEADGGAIQGEAGVELYFWYVDSDGTGWFENIPIYRTVNADDPTFHFPFAEIEWYALIPGRFRLEIDPWYEGVFPAVPYEFWVEDATQDFEVPATDTRLTNAQLAVTVRKPPRPGGAEAPARVKVRCEEHNIWQEAPSNIGAPALFGGLPHDTAFALTCQVRAEPVLEDSPAFAPSAWEPVLITADPYGDTPQQKEVYLRASNVTGQVVLPDGVTPAGCVELGEGWFEAPHIYIHTTNWDWEEEFATTCRGQFGLHLPPGEYGIEASLPEEVYTYTKSLPRAFPKRLGIPVAFDGVDEAPLRLTYPAVRGFVVDEVGNEYDAGVGLWSEGNDIWRWDDTGWKEDSDTGAGYWKPYQFGGLPVGRYFIQGEVWEEYDPTDPAGGLSGRTVITEVIVAEGDPYDETALQQKNLLLAKPSIIGWVVTENGEMAGYGYVELVTANAADMEYVATVDYYAEEPFVFYDIPPGNYMVKAFPDEDTGFGESMWTEVGVPTGEPGYVDITVSRLTAAIRGLVYFPPIDPDALPPNVDRDICQEDTATGKLICPAWDTGVEIFTDDWSEFYWTNVQWNGEFVFYDVPPGDYNINFYVPWYAGGWLPPAVAPEYQPIPYDGTAEVTVTGPDGAPLVLRRANKSVYGLVRYATSADLGILQTAPITNAMVYAAREDGPGWAETHVDHTGMYTLSMGSGLWNIWVEPDYSGTVDWIFDRERHQASVFFEYDNTVQRLNIDLPVIETNIQVTGKVLDPDGDAPPEDVWAEVGLWRDDGFGASGRVLPETEPLSGTFRINVMPGLYYLHFEPWSGFAPPTENGMTILITETVDLGTFQLRRRDASVSGRVVITPSEEGLVGLPVFADSDDGWENARTITNGFFTIDLFPGYWRVAPGDTARYIILDTSEHPRVWEGEVSGDETGIEFWAVRREASIKGQIVDYATDLPVSGLDAFVYASSDENLAGDLVFPIDLDIPVEGSNYELFVPGRRIYEVGVWLPPGAGLGGDDVAAWVEYIPGPPITVPIRAGTVVTIPLYVHKADATIFGTLVDPDGNEVILEEGEAHVFACRRDFCADEDTIDPDNTDYVLNVTPNITWTIGFWVEPESGYVAEEKRAARIYLTPGAEPFKLDLPVRQVGGISGIITGTVLADGAPVPYAWAYAYNDDLDLEFGDETDENGEFELDVFAIDEPYLVGAAVPETLEDNYFPPDEQEIIAPDTGIILRLRPRVVPGEPGALEISGALLVSPTGELADGTVVDIYGESEELEVYVTGTIGSASYHIPVISNTTWYLWAVYEDETNDQFFESEMLEVEVSEESVSDQDLTLELADIALPDQLCWEFDSDSSKRLELPYEGNLFPPTIDIRANTFPISGTVRVCAKPARAVRGGADVIGFAYELKALDSSGYPITQNFNKTVRFMFYYDIPALKRVPAYPLLGAYPSPKRLRIAYYSTSKGRWLPLEDVSVDLEDMFVTGKVNHFSAYGMMSTAGARTHTIYLPLIFKNLGG